MFFNEKIKALKDAAGSCKERSAALSAAETGLWTELDKQKSQLLKLLNDFYYKKAAENAQQLNISANKNRQYDISGWDIEKWEVWKPAMHIPRKLFLGQMAEQTPFIRELAATPAFTDFIGSRNCYFIYGSDAQSNDVYAFLQSLGLRLFTQLLWHSVFTFIDPSGLGKAFPIAKQLPVRNETGDLYRLLGRIIEDIISLNQTYGLSDDNMFDSIADTILINEKFEFIFAANFPKDYDSRAIEHLLKIADQGPIAGKYVFIHYNSDIEIKDERIKKQLESLSNAYYITLGDQGFIFNTGSKKTPALKWIPDEKPTDTVIALVKKIIAETTPPPTAIRWAKPGKYWTESSHEYIETIIGQEGNNAEMPVWLGRKQSENGRQCAHGVLAGATGSGKSNFLHNLVLGLASRYSPQELSLSLIDLKEGVEFQVYKHLPHAAFISLNTTTNLALSVLKDAVDEIARRNEIFADQFSVTDYEQYRKKAGKDFAFPRKLLIIDEYQRLFTSASGTGSDIQFEASSHLLRISQQGRSAGIHMILSSQDFDVPNFMHRQASLSNTHLRIAMQLAPEKRDTTIEFRKEAKLLIAKCETPGQIVINSNGGNDGYNKFGKASKLDDGQIENTISELNELNQSSGKAYTVTGSNIFNGNDQPNIIDNTQLAFFLNTRKPLSATETETFARKPLHEGGLGETNWFSGETPLAYWLGQEFNVRGHAHIITRRRRRENTLIIGDNNNARYGIKLGILSSAVLNTSGLVEFYIADKSIPGTPWSNILEQAGAKIIGAKKLKYLFASANKEITAFLALLQQEVLKRKETPDEQREHMPTIIFIGADLDRIESLNLQQSKFGLPEETEEGKILSYIATEGPALGIHSFLSFEGVMPMNNVFQKKNLEFFRHRVALQMSDQDAFDFVKHRDASRLQAHGPKPVAAFYKDIGSNKSSTFKPYIASKGIPEDLVQKIAKS